MTKAKRSRCPKSPVRREAQPLACLLSCLAMILGLLTDGTPLRHAAGRAIVHNGRALHSSKDITSGERYNLIVWCRFHESPFDVHPPPIIIPVIVASVPS